MNYTRVDTKKLTADCEKAAKKLDEALAILGPYLVIMSDKDRAVTPRARDGFAPAARALTRAIAEHPNVAAASEFDDAAVLEDLANVEVLQPVWEKVGEISQRLADTKLTWLAEAWVPSLTAYGVAKALANTNASLRTVIAPLADIFATRRARAQKANGEAKPNNEKSAPQ